MGKALFLTVVAILALGYLATTQVPSTAPAQDELAAFVASVQNGQSDQVVGVYVPGRFALPVVQPPTGADGYVSDAPDVATQFLKPAEYEVIGLLAHNYLAGSKFFSIKKGDRVVVVYGDGSHVNYVVDRLTEAQALQPESPKSEFLFRGPLATMRYPASEMFKEVYTTPDTVVFQTCVEAAGEPSWGRLWVQASRYIGE